MNDVEIVNAKIGKTYLGNGDGYLTYIIHVEWDGAGTGFGTHDLRYYGKDKWLDLDRMRDKIEEKVNNET